MLKSYSMTYLLIMVVGVLGTRLVAVYGWLALLPSLIAFIFISIVFHNYVDGLHKIEQKMGEVKSLNDSFLTAMAAAIDARDPYTHGHSKRVAFWGRELAAAVGLAKKQIDEVYFGGILHDVGKIGIEDAILNKEGKLTPEEFDRIKQHPVIGYEIVKQSGVFAELLPAIRSHHERIDGKGYPDGLQGDNIPVIARILAISDAFDAMVSDRPYRRGLSIEAALQQIRDGAGSQFDADYAVKFIELLNGYSKVELESLIRSNSPKKD
jgi:putative nucleotidyltransferase with HDIG domain